MDEDLAWLVSYLPMYSLAFPSVVGLMRYRRLQHIQRTLLVLSLMTITAEIMGCWIEIQPLVYDLFNILEFSLLSHIFARALKPIISDFFIYTILTSFILLILIDTLWISGMGQFKSSPTVLKSILIILLALCFFHKTLNELKIKKLEKEPMVWVSIGVLLYFSSSLFYFILTSNSIESSGDLFIMYGINSIFWVILQVFYTIALWVQPPIQ